MAGTHGGRRPGAGRKPRAEKYARPIAAAERKIIDKLPLIVDAMVELALGVTVEETDKEGGVNVYTRPPCWRSCQYLTNRIMGTPVQQVTGEDGAPLVAGGASVVITMPDNGRSSAPVSAPTADAGDVGEDEDADAIGEE